MYENFRMKSLDDDMRKLHNKAHDTFRDYILIIERMVTITCTSASYNLNKNLIQTKHRPNNLIMSAELMPTCKFSIKSKKCPSTHNSTLIKT